MTSMPAELGDLASLTLLNLDDNQLTSVPKELGGAVQIVRPWADRGYTIHAEASQSYLSSLRIALLSPLSSPPHLVSAPVSSYNMMDRLQTLLPISVRAATIPEPRRIEDAADQPKSAGGRAGGAGEPPALENLGLIQNQLTSVPAELGRVVHVDPALIALDSRAYNMLNCFHVLQLISSCASTIRTAHRAEGFVPRRQQADECAERARWGGAVLNKL